MTIHIVGTVAIFFAMAVAFFQKSDVQARTASVPRLTLAASILLLAVGVVDVYLYIEDTKLYAPFLWVFNHGDRFHTVLAQARYR